MDSIKDFKEFMNITIRNFRELKVKDVNNEELLFELLQRSSLSLGPTKKVFYTPHIESNIGIGNDDTAYIQLDEESFQVLKKRIKKTNPGLT